MKLTRRILVAILSIALIISCFAITISAEEEEFGADNIEDYLEYLDMPRYINDDFSSYVSGSAVDYLKGKALSNTVKISIPTEKSEIVTLTETNEEEEKTYENKALSYYFVAEDSDPGYFGTKFTFTEGVSELIFSMRVRAEKGRAKMLPTYTLNLSVYDENGVPIGEDSMVSPITVNFETGEVSYAKVSATNASLFSNALIEDFTVNEDEWYDVFIMFDCTKGSYRFTITGAEEGDVFESEELSLGNAATIGEILPSFVTYPTCSGSYCYFDDFEAYSGTFVRGYEELSEITALTLDKLATFIADNELDFETRERIIKVYIRIIESDYVPQFEDNYTQEEIEALYYGAIEYITATRTEAFINEVMSIDPSKSYSRRLIKIEAIEKYLTPDPDRKPYEEIYTEDFYLENIKSAVTKIEALVEKEFSKAIKDAEYALSRAAADEKEDLQAALDEIKENRKTAENALSAYKIALYKNSNAETRVQTLGEALDAILSAFEDSSEEYSANIEKIALNEEGLATIRECFRVYETELESINALKTDSMEFVEYMKKFKDGFETNGRNFVYLSSACGQLASYVNRDNSYLYSEDVFSYYEDYEKLVALVNEVTEKVNLFKAAVAVTEEEGVDFDRLFNEGYLAAKAIYGDGNIHDDIDEDTIPGFREAETKLLEIEKYLSDVIEASENFIKVVDAIKYNTILANKKLALEEAKLLLAGDENIKETYPLVPEAIAELDAIEKEIAELEKAAADYIESVNAIAGKKNFNDKKAAVEKAIKLQAKGNVIGIEGVAEANNALENYKTEIELIEGYSKAFIEAVGKLDNDELTLAERRALIVTAEAVRNSAAATYNGVSAAMSALDDYKAEYVASVQEINDEFNASVVSVASAASSVINQSRFNNVIAILKKIFE